MRRGQGDERLRKGRMKDWKEVGRGRERIEEKQGEGKEEERGGGKVTNKMRRWGG